MPVSCHQSWKTPAPDEAKAILSAVKLPSGAVTASGVTVIPVEPPADQTLLLKSSDHASRFTLERAAEPCGTFAAVSPSRKQPLRPRRAVSIAFHASAEARDMGGMVISASQNSAGHSNDCSLPVNGDCENAT